MNLRILAIVAASLALAGCAFGDEKLNLALDTSAAKPGVLSEAPPAIVFVTDVKDERPEQRAIGYKRNGYGAKTAKILSVRPEPDLVKEALTTTLEKNGHKIGAAGERFAVDTKLRKFWFDYKTGLVTVEFYGNVQAEVSLRDQVTGETLYTEVHDGYHSRKLGGGLAKTWTNIMNAALADFASKVNLSPGLKDALAKASASPAASAAPLAADKAGS